MGSTQTRDGSMGPQDDVEVRFRGIASWASCFDPRVAHVRLAECLMWLDDNGYTAHMTASERAATLLMPPPPPPPASRTN